VKAPGVAPLQSTTALAANARIDGKRTTSRQIDKSLGPEERIVINIFPSHFLSCSVKKSGENTLPWRNRAAKGVVRENEKCFKKDRKKYTKFFQPRCAKNCEIGVAGQKHWETAYLRAKAARISWHLQSSSGRR
jgi:hypothetical protein